MASQSSATRQHYIAIFAMSFVALASQVLLTRFLSVIFYYHMAFAAITFAMLGLTGGAIKILMKPDVFAASKTNELLAKYGVRFALSYTLGIILLIDADIIKFSAFLSLLGTVYLLLYAFYCIGIYIALILTHFSKQTAKLYAADLVGAALGCIAIILLLFYVDPVSAMLILCTVICAISMKLAPATTPDRAKMFYKVVAGIFLLLSVTQTSLYLSNQGGLKLGWAKGELLRTPLYERWNTYSRVDVSPYDSKEPFGWGFAKKHPNTKIDQHFLRIDAQAGTVVTHFDGDLSKIAYLKDDIINSGYLLRPMEKVAIIGVGGGRDVLSALVFGAKKITGIELNPAIIEGLTKVFGDFTGHLDTRPGVTLINAEARSYLNSAHDNYDLIQISLIDTWAATAGGGLTLSENKLYTTDAWRDFLNTLNPNGVLAVSRWYTPEKYMGEYYRMLSIAADVLTKDFHVENPRQHILAAGAAHEVVTVLVSKSALTPAEVSQYKNRLKEHGFDLMLAPDYAGDKIAETIANGKADAAFYKEFPLDVTAPSDDRPFFFNMIPFKDALRYTLQSSEIKNVNFANTFATRVMFFVAGVTFFATLIMIVWPLFRYAGPREGLKDALPFIGYFICIGLGFMVVEITQMQRLMIFLGHPVYGLGVVLFTLLFFGGLGSYAVRAKDITLQYALSKATLLVAVLVAVCLLTPGITEALKVQPIVIRILVSVVMIGSAGFCMGWMFPLGFALAKQAHPKLLPWFWGANGAASVLASVAAVMLSMAYGITATFWVGILAYTGCVILLWRMKKA